MKLTLKEAQEMMSKCGGSLDLYKTDITVLPSSLMVPGNVYLYNTNLTALPNNLIVGGNLDLYNTGITSLPKDLIVGGNLDLSCTPIVKLPDGLVVGGDLDLRRTKITSLPEGLTVGGSLYLCSNNIIRLPKSLKVGGNIFANIFDRDCYKLKNEEYVPGKYLYVNGFLTHVKSVIKRGEYTIYIGRVKGRYILSNGKYYSCCNRIREGIADLLFQKAKLQGPKQYKVLNCDSVVTREEAIAMYRVITGASKFGTEYFVSNIKTLKENYTIAEIIELTSGQYGSRRFANFFKSTLKLGEVE